MSTFIELHKRNDSGDDLKANDYDEGDVEQQLFTFKLLFGASRGDIR